MDRREALKKLAAGTVLTLASPLIVKSSAFADTGSASCQPFPFDNPVTVVGTSMGVAGVPIAPANPLWVQVQVRDNTTAFTNIACPTGAPAFEYRWNVTGPTPGPGTGTPIVHSPSGNDITNDWTTNRRIYIVTDVGAGNLIDAGQYTVTVNFKVTCIDGARTCWKCATLTAVFTWTLGTTNAVTIDSRSGVATPAGCD